MKAKIRQKVSQFLDKKAIDIKHTNKENESVFELEATTGFLLAIPAGILLGTFGVLFVIKPLFTLIF